MTKGDEQKFILLKPVFQNKIWGGRSLQSWGYNIPDGPVGEAWCISAHPHGDCEVISEPYASYKLSELYGTHRELFGSIDADKFPLLVKIIDAQDDLSIQVHPDDEYAYKHEHQSLGKRECWYVLDAKPGATIVVGQKAHSKDEFSKKVNDGAWDELLNELPIQKGDFFQIDPGCVHAIKGGTMILETQQSSDITYRVYDYDRVQEDGTLRDLHLEKSLDVIDYDSQCPHQAIHPNLDENKLYELVCTPDYTVDIIKVKDKAILKFNDPFTCVSVIEGSGSILGKEVSKGTHGIVLYGVDELELEGSMTVILSHL